MSKKVMYSDDMEFINVSFDDDGMGGYFANDQVIKAIRYAIRSGDKVTVDTRILENLIGRIATQ